MAVSLYYRSSVSPYLPINPPELSHYYPPIVSSSNSDSTAIIPCEADRLVPVSSSYRQLRVALSMHKLYVAQIADPWGRPEKPYHVTVRLCVAANQGKECQVVHMDLTFSSLFVLYKRALEELSDLLFGKEEINPLRPLREVRHLILAFLTHVPIGEAISWFRQAKYDLGIQNDAEALRTFSNRNSRLIQLRDESELEKDELVPPEFSLRITNYRSPEPDRRHIGIVARSQRGYQPEKKEYADLRLTNLFRIYRRTLTPLMRFLFAERASDVYRKHKEGSSLDGRVSQALKSIKITICQYLAFEHGEREGLEFLGRARVLAGLARNPSEPVKFGDISAITREETYYTEVRENGLVYLKEHRNKGLFESMEAQEEAERQALLPRNQDFYVSRNMDTHRVYAVFWIGARLEGKHASSEICFENPHIQSMQTLKALTKWYLDDSTLKLVSHYLFGSIRQNAITIFERAKAKAKNSFPHDFYYLRNSSYLSESVVEFEKERWENAPAEIDLQLSVPHYYCDVVSIRATRRSLFSVEQASHTFNLGERFKPSAFREAALDEARSIYELAKSQMDKRFTNEFETLYHLTYYQHRLLSHAQKIVLQRREPPLPPKVPLPQNEVETLTATVTKFHLHGRLKTVTLECYASSYNIVQQPIVLMDFFEIYARALGGVLPALGKKDRLIIASYITPTCEERALSIFHAIRNDKLGEKTFWSALWHIRTNSNLLNSLEDLRCDREAEELKPLLPSEEALTAFFPPFKDDYDYSAVTKFYHDLSAPKPATKRIA